MDIENPTLKETVTKESPLKEIFVNYVGKKVHPDKENVTVEDIVEVLSKEFPEFLMVIAEENFIRGYKQAFADIESEEPKGKKLNKRRI
jgi:hypothetical protein